MSKFNNLPVGTVVELTEDAARMCKMKYDIIENTMTITGRYNCFKSPLPYRTKELENISKNIDPKHIKRVISYPINRDKLQPGVKVKIREDLEDGVRYGNDVFAKGMKKYTKVPVTIEALDAEYFFIEEDDGRFYWTPEMVECIVDEPKERVKNMAYIETELKKIGELVARKNADYDNSFDKSIDKYGVLAYQIRMFDKMSRFENLVGREETMKVNESIDDTLSDIIGYTILMKNYLQKDKLTRKETVIYGCSDGREYTY